MSTHGKTTLQRARCTGMPVILPGYIGPTPTCICVVSFAMCFAWSPIFFLHSMLAFSSSRVFAPAARTDWSNSCLRAAYCVPIFFWCICISFAEWLSCIRARTRVHECVCMRAHTRACARVCMGACACARAHTPSRRGKHARLRARECARTADVALSRAIGDGWAPRTCCSSPGSCTKST